MVAKRLMVTRQAQDVTDAVDIGTHQVALHGQPVAIPAGHLDNRLKPMLGHINAGRDAAETHNTGLIVGHIGGINHALQKIDLAVDDAGIHVFGWTQFAGDGKVSCSQDFFKIAPGLEIGQGVSSSVSSHHQ